MVEHLLSKSTDTLTAIEEDFKEEDSAAEKDEENRQGNANYANQLSQIVDDENDDGEVDIDDDEEENCQINANYATNLG